MPLSVVTWLTATSLVRLREDGAEAGQHLVGVVRDRDAVDDEAVALDGVHERDQQGRMLLVGDDDLVARRPGEAGDDDVDRRRELGGEGDLVRIGPDEVRERRAGGLDPEKILVVGEEAGGAFGDDRLGDAEQFRADFRRAAARCRHN